MAFNSISDSKKNRVYAPILLGLAILLAILLAKPAFSEYSDVQISLTNVQQAEEKLKAEESKLTAQEKNLQEGTDLYKQVEKIGKGLSESDIFQALFVGNPYTRPNGISTESALVEVSEVNIDYGNKLPNGIYYGTVNLTLTANSVNSIVEYLSFLTKSAPMAFTINDISLPIDTIPIGNEKAVSIPVVLGIYYYK